MKAALFILLPLTLLSQTLAPKGPRANIPAAPVYSRDGCIVVKAGLAQSAVRSPVLVFAERTRQDLARATHLKFSPQNGLLEIVIGAKNDGDKSVHLTRKLDVQGGDRETIYLPDPATADLRELRRCVCVALFRLWVVDVAIEKGTKPADLPMWLIEGVIRHLDRNGRQADIDRTLALWSHACLPAAQELFALDSKAAKAEPAVSGVIASWFLSRRNNVMVLESALRSAALGRSWSAKQAALLLEQTEDLAAFDEAVDKRLLSERRAIIFPGTTTPGMVRRFRENLRVYSNSFREDRGRGWSFHQIAALASKSPHLRIFASRQADRVLTASAGRDALFRETATAYETFLRAVARNAKPGETAKLLMAAEDLRAGLEESAAQGKTLQDSGLDSHE